MTTSREQDLSPPVRFLERMLVRNDEPGMPFLDAAERERIASIISNAITHGTSEVLVRDTQSALEFLREHDSRWQFLDYQDRSDHTERNELDGLINPPALRDKPTANRSQPHPRGRLPRRWLVLLAGLLAAISVVVVLLLTFATQPIGSPAGSNPAVPPIAVQQQQPPEDSPVEQTEAAFGPWKVIAPSAENPDTGSPAVLELLGAQTKASTGHSVPASAKGWQPTDAGSFIAHIEIAGDHVTITDVYGLSYIVGVDQAFWFRSDPYTLYRITRDKKVFAITLAQAILARHPLSH